MRALTSRERWNTTPLQVSNTRYWPSRNWITTAKNCSQPGLPHICPPSNILSRGPPDAGGKFPSNQSHLGHLPSSGLNFSRNLMSPDGIINVPRIISGSDLDGFERWAAINELNFHYVNSHFFTRRRADPERGAKKAGTAYFGILRIMSVGCTIRPRA